MFFPVYLYWQGNFELWSTDPLHVRPVAHVIWDPAGLNIEIVRFILHFEIFREN